MVGSSLTFTNDTETLQIHEIHNLKAAVKSSTNDIVVAGTHINNKFDDTAKNSTHYTNQFVFMYYLDYDTDCEIKWMKATTDFDEIRDI